MLINHERKIFKFATEVDQVQTVHAETQSGRASADSNRNCSKTGLNVKKQTKSLQSSSAEKQAAAVFKQKLEQPPWKLPEFLRSHTTLRDESR